MSKTRDVSNFHLDCVGACYNHIYCVEIYNVDSSKSQQRVRDAIEILYFIFANTEAGYGDKIKISKHLESLISKEEKNDLKLKFLKNISKVLSLHLMPKVSSHLKIGGHDFNILRITYIAQLIFYIADKAIRWDIKQYPPNVEETDKLNTAMDALQELLQPNPDFAKLAAILSDYKDRIDKNSFFKKCHLQSRDGGPGHLRYILKGIINSKSSLSCGFAGSSMSL